MDATQAAKLLFWACAGLIVYTYCGYPLLLWIFTRRARREALPRAEDLPFVSVLIAAYNEAAVLPAKLVNGAALDYPAERLEFLYGSDGSDDATGDLIRAQGGNVHLHEYPARQGKAAVLNKLAPHARGEILVFTDANSMFEPDAVRQLVRHFQDPRVGGVCGRLVLQQRGGRGGSEADETLYWRYESWIKAWEGQLGLLAAANGGIYAVRKPLFQPLPTNRLVMDDLIIGSRVLLQGYQVTFASEAVARESVAPDRRTELRRKIRISEGVFNLWPQLWPLLLPWQGARAWMFWSHKVLRWMVPLLLMGALAASFGLWREPFYGAALLAQMAFYAAAALGAWLETRGHHPGWLSFPYYFTGANLALVLGFARSLARSNRPTWARLGR